MAGPTLEELQQEWDRQHGGANGEWRVKLLVTATKSPKPILANALTALRWAPEWEGVLAYDELEMATMAMRPPPFCKSKDNSWAPRPWAEQDDRLTAEWLHHQGVCVSANTVVPGAVETIARETSYHPVRDYLSGQEWDGVARVNQFTHKYLGAENTPYHAAVGSSTLVSAAARIFKPGCKVDTIPIFEGDQGAGKSTALHALFSPWFSDDLSELGTKDSKMEMNGVWCLEIAELTSMRKADVEKVKAFASRRDDRFRPSYGRRVIRAPRQCILAGTTNADRYLKDESGARRFLPARCGAVDIDAIIRDRDQLWAEAVMLYRRGTPWWFTDTLLIKAASDEQDERYMEDAWSAAISEYVYSKDVTSIGEVLEHAIGLETKYRDQLAQNRVAAILKKQGCWKRGQKGSGRDREYVYRRLKATGATKEED